MKVRILRGAHEIGGSCVEVAAPSGSRIVLDVGKPLWAGWDETVPLPPVPGLADGSDPSLAGVVISRSHLDHYGVDRPGGLDVPLYIANPRSTEASQHGGQTLASPDWRTLGRREGDSETLDPVASGLSGGSFLAVRWLVVTDTFRSPAPLPPLPVEGAMNDTERRTGNQGGAYIGGRWVSAEELRSRGRRVTDALARTAAGRVDVGTCPNCGERRPGATDGPGGSLFVLGSECSACGHVEAMDGLDR